MGLAKRPWLEAEIGAASLQLQRQLARVFDPAGILVPTGWLG